MTLDELRAVMAALMSARYYVLAKMVREEIVAREIARDAILDYVHGQ